MKIIQDVIENSKLSKFTIKKRFSMLLLIYTIIISKKYIDNYLFKLHQNFLYINIFKQSSDTKNFNIQKLKMKNIEQNPDQNDICPICLTVFYKPMFLNTCKHVFCQPCISEASDLYQQKKCPLCRKQFMRQDKTLQQKRQQDLQKKYPIIMKSRIANLKKDKLYRMEIGNITQVLNTEENNKYRWTLFVKPAPDEQQLEKYVQKVEVNLHHTFNPSKIIFGGNQAIELKRVGWGTFRIDIKIQWKKQYGGFVEVFHDLRFQPKVSKIMTCKLGIIH